MTDGWEHAPPPPTHPQHAAAPLREKICFSSSQEGGTMHDGIAPLPRTGGGGREDLGGEGTRGRPGTGHGPGNESPHARTGGWVGVVCELVPPSPFPAAGSPLPRPSLSCRPSSDYRGVCFPGPGASKSLCKSSCISSLGQSQPIMNAVSGMNIYIYIFIPLTAFIIG